MPTDVSGTINIIAEVVGNSSSPVTGTGNSSLGKPKKEESLHKQKVLCKQRQEENNVY